MAFAFKRRESIAHAVSRLGRRRLAHALACLDDCTRAGAIHCARKDIKKTRSLLRLVRSRLTKKDFRRLNRHLRSAANCLVVPRDAFIRTETLRDLTHHFRAQLTSGALRHVRAGLQKDFKHALKQFDQDHSAAAVCRKLRRARRELKHLKLRAWGWGALRPGLQTAYRQSQRGYEAVLADPGPANFHAWRKRAKDLLYQLALLHRIWPEQMEAATNELDALCESIGDDHDIAILREALDHLPDRDRHTRELETLHALIEQQQQELRTVALILAARFYVEKPSAFCHRLARYWHTWQREKNRTLRKLSGQPAP